MLSYQNKDKKAHFRRKTNMTTILETTLKNGIKVCVTFNGSHYTLETTFYGLVQRVVTRKAIEVFQEINTIQHFKPELSN